MKPASGAATVDGLILVDKPAGPTSHDVVRHVRRTLGLKRVGHTGTLDPFASGLLVLCVGAATRLSEYVARADKTYLAGVRLGARTRTHDPEGEVIATSDGWRDLTLAHVEQALAPLRGELLQRPPAFSAKKVGGEAAYRLARRGEFPALDPVPVTVHELEVVGVSLPDLRLRVRCSSGTYVRALARDLGEALGVGAHLSTLRRTRVGRHGVEEALTPDDLDDAERIRAALRAPSEAVAGLPRVDVDADGARRLALGQAVEASGYVDAEPVAVFSGGALVALARLERGLIRPRKVMGGGAALRRGR